MFHSWHTGAVNDGALVGGLQIFRSTIFFIVFGTMMEDWPLFSDGLVCHQSEKKIAQTQAIWAETVLPSAGVVVFKGRRLLGDGIAIRWSLMFLRFRSHSAFCSVRSVSDMFTLDHSQCFEGDVFSFHGYVGCLNISIARFPVLPLNLPCPGLEQGLEGWETELKTSTL